MDTELALIKLTGGRDLQQQFLEMSHLYDGAIREIRTRLEILDREFNIRYASNPIHHIDSRLKSPRSIIEKLQRKGWPVSVESAEEHLNDIAGVRIVCNYIDDIYRLANMLVRQKDLELVCQKDYIRNPKPNGYRSLHLVLRVPVFLSSHTELVPVEVQIRTIAMDFWASLEHQLRYKSDVEATTPLKVEQYLMRHIPQEDIPNAHHWLLLHGRYVCKSAKPLCADCPFDGFCPKLLKDSKL